MRPPSRFRARRVTQGDLVVTVRAIRPDDRDALRAAFHKLSPLSRYRRFQGHLSDLSPAMLRYLTEVDGDEHFAVVALLERPRRPALRALPGALFERWQAPPEIVGVARLIRLRPDTAEVAITVADALQRKGLGARLLSILVTHARRSGVETLVAHVLADNTPMRELLSKVGVVRPVDHDTVTVALPKKSARRADARRRAARAWRAGGVRFVLALRWLRIQRWSS